MHMHARTYFLPSIIISQTQGKLQRRGRPVSTGMKPRTEPLKEERGKRAGKRGNRSRELSLAMNTGKQIVWYQGWEPTKASRSMLLTSWLKGRR